MKTLYVTLSSVPVRGTRVLCKYTINTWKVGTVKGYTKSRVKVVCDDGTVFEMPAFSRNLFHLKMTTRSRKTALTDAQMFDYVKKNAYNKI